MAKKEVQQELAKSAPAPTALAEIDAPPAYLVTSDGRGKGTETAAANAIQVLAKIVQPQSGKELKDEAGEGSIILSPDKIVLHEHNGEPVTVIVVHQHESFECWSDINDTNSPTVMYRSVNPASALAARCQDADDANREESYGDGKFTRTYDVYHNFMCVVDSGEHKGKMFRMAFGGKWHRSARSWSSIIDERGKVGVPIFGARYDIKTEFVQRGVQQWYSAVATNPTKDRGGAWVGQDMLPALERFYDAAEAAYRREIANDAARAEAQEKAEAANLPPV